MDPVAVGTIALAVATGALAAFTCWLAWEARQARLEGRIERQRLAFRAALVEQLDNCREWHSHPPDRGVGTLQHLLGRAPHFEAVLNLLAVVDVPSDLAAFIVWLVADTRDWHQRFDARIAPPISLDDVFDPKDLRDFWWVLVDQLQVLACLIQTEAKRRGISGVVPAASQWLRPLPGSPQERVHLDASNRATGGAPPWPAGFEACSPAQRDADGAAQALEAQAQLRRGMGPA